LRDGSQLETSPIVNFGLRRNGIMEASVVVKGYDLVRAKSHPMRGAKASNDRDSVRALTQRFRNALKKSVAGIIEAGQVLIEAKSRIEHGQFTDWVDRELRFGAPHKNHSREANIRQAEMLMLLARNEVISNACHWHAFPPSIRTLYELTQVDKGRLLKLIKKGKVHAGTTREEAIGFQPKSKRFSKPELRTLKRPVATLLDVCLQLEEADCVLAHIRSLKRARRNLTVQMFEQAVRWAKPQLAKQKRDE
jgi:hypothetical protein